MQLRDGMKEFRHRSGMTQLEISEKAGYTTGSIFSGAIRKNDILFSSLARLVEAAGYKIQLVRIDHKEPEFPITLDPSDKPINVNRGKKPNLVSKEVDV